MLRLELDEWTWCYTVNDEDDDKDECLIKLLYYMRTSQLMLRTDEYYITSDIKNFII